MNIKKFGIMGGTFDPIHFGHLVIANEVLAKYKLERIIFVPTGNPPHKSLKGMSNSYHRYMMVQFATMTNPQFYVSNIEVNKKDICYTIDTIKELKCKYKDVQFYFITGTDAVLDLPNWKNTEEILRLCKFIAVNRPGYLKNNYKEEIEKLTSKHGGTIEIIKAPQLQISSTDIRDRIRNNRPIKYLLPETVEQYILKNELYKKNIYDILSINELKNKLKKNISSEKYRHSVNVMNTAIKLAELYNCNIKKTKVAALLHDCGRTENGLEILEIEEEYKKNKNLMHAIKGAYVADKEYNINNSDIINAIRYHTTGRENMSLLEKIVYIADKIEPDREYNGVQELRKLAYKDLDRAVLKALNNTIQFVKNNNLYLHKDTINARNWFREKISKDKTF